MLARARRVPARAAPTRAVFRADGRGSRRRRCCSTSSTRRCIARGPTRSPDRGAQRGIRARRRRSPRRGHRRRARAVVRFPVFGLKVLRVDRPGAARHDARSHASSVDLEATDADRAGRAVARSDADGPRRARSAICSPRWAAVDRRPAPSSWSRRGARLPRRDRAARTSGSRCSSSPRPPAASGRNARRRRPAAARSATPDDDSALRARAARATCATCSPPRSWPGALKSGELVKALNALEDAPWGGLRDGTGLSTHGSPATCCCSDLAPERDRRRRREGPRLVARDARARLGAVPGRLDDDAEDVKTGDSPDSPDQSVGQCRDRRRFSA